MNAASYFTGSGLTYSINQANGLQVTDWVNLNPATGMVTFTAGLSNVGWNYFQITASDGLSTSLMQPFGILVNSAPVINENLRTLYAIENIPFAVELPKGLFMDPDKNSLIITALVSPNSPLPNWLSFDSSTNILSGTPASTDTGTLILQL